jgi:hypothetical protein
VSSCWHGGIFLCTNAHAGTVSSFEGRYLILEYKNEVLCFCDAACSVTVKCPEDAIITALPTTCSYHLKSVSSSSSPTASTSHGSQPPRRYWPVADISRPCRRLVIAGNLLSSIIHSRILAFPSTWPLHSTLCGATRARPLFTPAPS